MVQTNLRILKRSRKELHSGDIFVLQVREGEFIFGRVIRTNANIGITTGTGQCILIYIYNAFSGDKNSIPVLDKNDLLVPPTITNRLGWSRGYFEVVAHQELGRDDVFRPHCFYSLSFRRYYDEYRRELPRRVEPCEVYALASFRGIDDRVSMALGIPPVPDDD